MLKSVIKSTGLFTLVGFAERGVAFLTFPLYASKISLEEYGAVDLVLLISILICIVVGLELYQGVVRFASESDEKGRDAILVNCLKITMLTSISAAIVLFFFGEFLLQFILRNRLVTEYSRVLAWMIPININIAVITYYLRSCLRNQMIAWTSLASLFVNFTFSYYLIMWMDWGGKGLLVGQCAANTFTLVIYLFLLRRKIFDKHIRFSLHELLTYTFPLVISSMASILAARLDRFAVFVYFGTLQVGLLGVGNRFSGVIMIVLNALVISLTPILYANYQNPETSGRVTVLLRNFIALSLISIPLITVVAQYYVVHFLPLSFHPALVYVPVIIATTCISQAGVFFPGLAIAKKSKIVLLIQIISLAMNVVLGYILHFHFGIMGICLAALISQTFSVMLYWHFGNKYYPIAVIWRNALAGILISIILISVWMYQFPKSLIVGILVLTLSVIICHIFRLTDFNAIFALVGKRFKFVNEK